MRQTSRPVMTEALEPRCLRSGDSYVITQVQHAGMLLPAVQAVREVSKLATVQVGGAVSAGVGPAGGGSDSVWLDMGYPILGGRECKPMFAFLVEDLDNAHGGGGDLAAMPRLSPS